MINLLSKTHEFINKYTFVKTNRAEAILVQNIGLGPGPGWGPYGPLWAHIWAHMGLPGQVLEKASTFRKTIWTNLARFGSKTHFLMKFLNDSALTGGSTRGT